MLGLCYKILIAGVLTGLTSVRRQPVLDKVNSTSSKLYPPLAKPEPINKVSGTSVKTDLRKGKITLYTL